MGRSNYMITGAKSTGKTVLMQGLRKFASLFCSDFLDIVFIDFAVEDGLISDKINPVIEDSFTESAITEWCNTHSKCILFFGDNFDSLYLSGLSSVKHEENKTNIKQLLALGKAPWSMGIISGSSATSSYLAFKDSDYISSEYSHSVFINLDRYCYKYRVIEPFRSKKEFHKVLKTTASAPAEFDVDRYFRYTGGIVGDIMRYGYFPTHKAHLKVELHQLMENKPFAFILRLLSIKNMSNDDRIWNQHGIEHYELPKALFEHPASTLLRLCHTNVLYKNLVNGKYEMMLPIYYNFLDDHYSQTDKKLQISLQSVWFSLDVPSLHSAIKNEYKQRLIKISDYSTYTLCEVSAYMNHSIPETNKIVYLNGSACIDGFIVTNSNEIHLLLIKLGSSTSKLIKGTANSNNSDTIFGLVNNAKTDYLHLSNMLTNRFDMEFVVKSITLFSSCRLTDQDLKRVQHTQVNWIETQVNFSFYGRDYFKELFKAEFAAIL